MVVEKIPVQMQLYYDSLDGAKHMHLVVRHVNVTYDDELFEESKSETTTKIFIPSLINSFILMTDMDRRIVGSYLINMQTEHLSAMRTTEELDPVVSTLYSKYKRPIFFFYKLLF